MELLNSLNLPLNSSFVSQQFMSSLQDQLMSPSQPKNNHCCPPNLNSECEKEEGKKSTPKKENKIIKICNNINLFNNSSFSLKRSSSSVTQKQQGNSNISPSACQNNFNLEAEHDSAETDFYSPIHLLPAILQASQFILTPPSSSSQIFNQSSNIQPEINNFHIQTNTNNGNEDIPNQTNSYLGKQRKILKTDLAAAPLLKRATARTKQQASAPLITQKKREKINSKMVTKKSSIKLENNNQPLSVKIINPATPGELSNSQYLTPIDYFRLSTSAYADGSTKTTKRKYISKIKPPTQLKKMGYQVQVPKQVYAEEVYLKFVSHEGSIKLKKFNCFKDTDFNIPPQFSQLIQQFSDDDKCSDDDLLEKAVNFLHKKLVASTIEMNPQAAIPDAKKVFTMNDIKIDRESEEEEDEDDQYEPLYYSQGYGSNNFSQSQKRSKHKTNNSNNNFLSDDEEEDDDSERVSNNSDEDDDHSLNEEDNYQN